MVVFVGSSDSSSALTASSLPPRPAPPDRGVNQRDGQLLGSQQTRLAVPLIELSFSFGLPLQSSSKQLTIN